MGGRQEGVPISERGRRNSILDKTYVRDTIWAVRHAMYDMLRTGSLTYKLQLSGSICAYVPGEMMQWYVIPENGGITHADKMLKPKLCT